jgi:predicted TIM-barrel fold metal-dependent hydrolase
LIAPYIGGSFDKDPKVMQAQMSKSSLKIVNESFQGINPSCSRDVHSHLAGLGKNNSGIWVTPAMQEGYAFSRRLKFEVYLSASGITDRNNADNQYIDRLLSLVSIFPKGHKTHVLAFDYHYSFDGKKDLEHSTFYVPNNYAYKVASLYPDKLIATISVHPYRKDAIEELEKWAEKGVKYVKWLPNAQGIDPAHERVIPFYKTMKKYGMTLLTHTGDEKAIESEDFQKFGNPLRLKNALNLGVKVIVAHVASLGECSDFENGNARVACFDLFWRLFNNKAYEKNMFADISAVTIYNRVGKPVNTLLANPQLHHRLVNGSDYPLPAINILYRLEPLLDKNYLTEKDVTALKEIYRYNPILFDFVLKRLIKHPQTGQKFSNKAFEIPTELGCDK